MRAFLKGALLSVAVTAAFPEPAPAPAADLTVLEHLDLSGVRAGDRVVYAGTISAPGGERETWTSTTACVEADADSVLVETDRGVTGRRKGRWRARAPRTGSVPSALWWVAAEGGEPVAVDLPAQAPPKPPKLSGAGTVTRETITVAGRELACLKLTCTVTETGRRKDDTETYEWIRWFTDEIPFPRRIRHGEPDTLTWDAEVPASSGLARMEFRYPDGETVVTEVSAWTRGAEPPATEKR